MIVRIDKEMDCFAICKGIQKMINSYQKKESLENKTISIKIVDMHEDGGYNVKRLEYKGEIR